MNVYANDFNTTVQTYYTELGKYNPISLEKEQELFKLVRCEDNLNAKNAILEAHLKYVFNVAKKYKGKGVPLEELIAEGNVGLTKAIDKFDENRGIKFITYAKWWIIQSIQECLNKKIKVASNECLEDEDIHNKNIEHYNNDIDYNDYYVDYDEEYYNGSNERYYLTSEDDDSINELNVSKHNIINYLLEKLPNRGKTIMTRYYGLNNSDEKKLEEIGAELGITKERVRQIKEKCLKIMRSEILLIDNYDDLFL